MVSVATMAGIFPPTEVCLSIATFLLTKLLISILAYLISKALAIRTYVDNSSPYHLDIVGKIASEIGIFDT